MPESSQVSWYETKLARHREKQSRLADVLPLAARIENKLNLDRKGTHPDFYTINTQCEGQWRYYWFTQEHKLYYLPDAPTLQLQCIAKNDGYGSPGKAVICRAILRRRGLTK